MKTVWQDQDIRVFLDHVPTSWPANSFLLSENEMSYCLKSPHENIQRSRAQLRLMVKEILDDSESEITHGDLGRPLVSPVLDVSFSHKDNFALVGLTKAPGKIGVDIEPLEQTIDWSVFNTHFFTSDDLQSLRHLQMATCWGEHTSQLALFSLKEAFFKAIDSHFSPTQLGLIFSHCQDGQAHFTITHKCSGSLATPEGMRLVVFIDDRNVIAICYLQNWK